MRFSMYTYLGEGTKLSIISSFFKKMTISLLFQNSFNLGEAISLHLFRVTFSKFQLIFWRSYFFRPAAFSEELLFITITYQQQVFFQNSYFFRLKFLSSSHFLRIGQLLLGTAIFLEEDLFKIKISRKILCKYFCTTSTFSEKQHFEKRQLLRKAIFRITYFSGELS